MSRKTAAKRPFTIPSAGGKPSADTAACRWRRLYAQSERAQWPPPGGGGKRGQGHRMVPLPPLDSPKPSFKPRRPSVARQNARGSQGRSVLQGYILDGSGAFRSANLTPCTVWPRTVMRGNSRKVNSGHNSVPKSARRTEPSPPYPRFAAHLRCVSAKEGKGSQEGTGNHVWCPVPFCPCRWAPTPPGRRRRPLSTLTLSVKSPPPAAPLYRRNRVPSAEGKENFQILLDKGRGV